MSAKPSSKANGDESASASVQLDETGLNLEVVEKFNDESSGKDDRKEFIEEVWKSFKPDDLECMQHC